MIKEEELQKIWEVFFYVSCVRYFRDKSIDDSIRYIVQAPDIEIDEVSYETPNEVNISTEKLVNILKKEYENKHISYHYLSSLIYEYQYDYTREDFELSPFHDYAIKSDNEVVKKIMDHIYLNINYKSEIQKVKNTILGYDEKYKELDNSYQSLKDSYDKLQGQYNNVTVDFITILGIFTGCVFAVFGGFEGIKAVLEINNVSKMVMVASIVLFVIVVVLFSFIQFIGALTGRKVVSCNCDLTNNQGHQCRYYERYRILTISLSISLFLFGIGLLMTPPIFIRHTGVLRLICINWKNIVGFLIILIIAAPIIWYMFRNKRKDSNAK